MKNDRREDISQPTRTITTSENAMTYAGFWKRLVAYIIDSALLGTVGFIVSLPFLGLVGIGAMSAHDEPEAAAGVIMAAVGAYLIVLGAMAVVGWLYFALMESSGAQGTLGKMALGIKVTDLQGNRISFGRASGRYFGKILSSLILNIGYVIAGFTQQKQALHDIIAGCLVVNK
jgi:uncharacterized RDD family membrane protein YckC